MDIKELQTKWNKEKGYYKTKEVGDGLQHFIRQLFECPALFNLKQGSGVTKHTKRKNEFTIETRKRDKAGQADYIIFIDGINIVIPVEVEKYENIKAGEKQLLKYQLAWDRKYGILTDGFTWRFYNNTSYITFNIDDLFSNTKIFLTFWKEYIKPENYYLSFFEEQGQLSLFQKNSVKVERDRELFFEDITRLIDNFKNKLNLAGYFNSKDKKENDKKATEITYAYFIQFILYKNLVDNCYHSFEDEFKQRIEAIHRSLKAEVYDAVLTNIKSISKFISEKLYKPFNKEQEFINIHLEEILNKPKTELSDISLWLDIIVFINRYDFSNISKDIFGYIYENYLKDLYDETNKGQYFTDPAIVEFMLDEIGYTERTIQNKYQQGKLKELSLIDPSCGSGTFLYCATNRLINALWDDNTEKKSKLVEDAINNNIFGLDIAEFPLYLAEMNILMRMLPLIVNEKYNNPIDKKIKVFKTNDSVSEFLDIRGQNLQGDLFNQKLLALGYASYIRNEDDLKDMKTSLIPPKKRFDYVIGNPPYIGYNECCKQKL